MDAVPGVKLSFASAGAPLKVYSEAVAWWSTARAGTNVLHSLTHEWELPGSSGLQLGWEVADHRRPGAGKGRGLCFQGMPSSGEANEQLIKGKDLCF